MEIASTERKGISSNALKYIAIAAMLIDHIAWAFVPFGSIAGQIMHLIGRFTAPIMCYFIAEGYFYTRNIGKYMLRLGIFAVISQVPYVMAEMLTDVPFSIKDGYLCVNPELFSPNFNVFNTLFLGLLALFAWNRIRSNFLRITAVVAICLLSASGDWMFFSVLWIFFFGIFRGDFRKQVISYYIIAVSEIFMIAGMRILNGNFSPFLLIWQSGLLLPPVFFALYNGKRGSSHPFHKWFFYAFYPIHLLVIGIIKLYF